MVAGAGARGKGRCGAARTLMGRVGGGVKNPTEFWQLLDYFSILVYIEQERVFVNMINRLMIKRLA